MLFFASAWRKSMVVGGIVAIQKKTKEASPMNERRNQNDEAHHRLAAAERELFRFFQLPLPPPAAYQLSASSWSTVDDDERELFPKKAIPAKKARQSVPPQMAPKDQPSSAPTERRATCYRLPPPPSTWPQRPILIRATPGTSTQIVGIRYNDGGSGNREEDDYESKTTCTPKKEESTFWDDHSAVPINTGKEEAGHSIVVDFVSEQFVGTLLIRIQGIPPPPPFAASSNNKEDNTAMHTSDTDYFADRQRTFQGVVKGRFRHPTPLQDCVTGQTFRRPAGTLPAHWIVQAFQRLVQRLAPHNDLQLEGDRPRSLAPLITTAQTIRVGDPSTITTPQTPIHHPSQENDSHQGLVLHDGHFFYDSIHDHHNHCYSSNSIPHMEQDWQEPPATETSSLIYQVTNCRKARNSVDTSPGSTRKSFTSAAALSNHSHKNRKYRKSFFNKLLKSWKQQQQHTTNTDDTTQVANINSSRLPEFVTDKDYTFEFYEHLVVFDNPAGLVLNLKLPFLHHIAVAPCTNGQPIQFMSAVRRPRRPEHSNKDQPSVHDSSLEDDLDYLWSFEVWHESLYNAIPSSC